MDENQAKGRGDWQAVLDFLDMFRPGQGKVHCIKFLMIQYSSRIAFSRGETH